MTKLFTYNQKEQQLKQLQEELKLLSEDAELKKEVEFKTKLEELMSIYEVSNSYVVKILAPEDFLAESKKTRKPRKLKVYKNPHTGEVLKVRGGNQNTLKAWKKEHGREEVEKWVTNDNIETTETTEVEVETKQEEKPPVEVKAKPKAKKEPTQEKPATTAKRTTKGSKKLPLPLPMKPISGKPSFKYVPR